MGSLQQILPEEISSSAEEVILKKVKAKMFAGAAMLVTAVRAIEEAYGEEGVEVIHNAISNRILELTKQKVEQSKECSLEQICSSIGSNGTQEWTNEGDAKHRLFKFTRCMWAEVFRELNAEDIGFWICEGDLLAAEIFSSFNIEFKRSKTLMQGHDICNHEFYSTN